MARLWDWGMWSMPSLPLLPGPLWPGVVVLDRDLCGSNRTKCVCEEMTDVKLWLLYRNTWNYLTVQKKSSGSFKNAIYKMCLLNHIYLMYKEDLALNNPQGLICHKPDQTIFFFFLFPSLIICLCVFSLNLLL